MRSEADIIHVQATITRRLTLDLERLERDPVWLSISEQYPIVPGTEVADAMVSAYINHYILRDQFPHQTPSTNGPGDIDEIKLEIKWPKPQPLPQ
jgi:hypothetical protein